MIIVIKGSFFFNFLLDCLVYSKTNLKYLWHHNPCERRMIYREEVRDRLDDPLATNCKCLSKGEYWKTGAKS